MPLIGMFMNLAEDDRETSSRRDAFLLGLGPVKGLRIAMRFGAADYAGYRQKAQALADLNPDLYLASCGPTLRALEGVRSPGTPIVFAGLYDVRSNPGSGYGSNIYGFISYGANLCAQWPGLLREIAPNVARAAVIYDMNPSRPWAGIAYGAIDAEAKKLTPPLLVSGIDVGDPALVNKIIAFANDPNGGPGGLIIPASTWAAKLRNTIIRTAETNNLPAIYPNRLYAIHGGLISLGTYLHDQYLSAGRYANQILNGHMPSIDATQTGNIPGKAAKFEMVINLNAAAAINLTVDPALLAKADLVIHRSLSD